MTVDYFAAPPRRSFARYLADNNPFYVLSAACMLTGIFLLNNSLTWSPLPKRNLLALIVTLNVYELLLVGLAAILLRRNIIRDATGILLIEALFMADAGFLNMEIFGVDPSLGLIVNIVLLLLCVGKLAVIFRAARLEVASPLYAFILAQLAILFAIPGIFAAVATSHAGKVPDLIEYAAWWTLAALPVMFVALCGGASRVASGVGGSIARIFIVLPIVSLFAHLALSHWVYKVTFQLANLAPLMLGMTVAIGHADVRMENLAKRLRTQLALPAAAIFLGLFNTQDSIFNIGPIQLAPMRITLLAGALVYLDGFAVHRQFLFLFFSAASLGGAAFGATPESVTDNIAYLGDRTLRAKQSLTRATWGVFCVIVAFALLGVGALVSLKSAKSQSPVDAAPRA